MLSSRQYLCSLCARRCSVSCSVRIRQCSRMFTCACDAEPDEKSSGSSLLLPSHSAYTSSCSGLGNGRKSSNSLTASSNTTTTSTSNSNQIHISSNKTNGHPPSQFSDPNHNRDSSPTFNRSSSSSGESRGAQQPQTQPQPQEQQEQQKQQPMHSVLVSTSGHRGDAGELAYNPHGGHSSHGYMPQQLDAGPWTLPGVQPPSSAFASQNYVTDYAHSPQINGAFPPKPKVVVLLIYENCSIKFHENNCD